MITGSSRGGEAACGAARSRWRRSVSRRLENLTLDNLDDLPDRCRRCIVWELDPVAAQAAVRAGDPRLEKEAWISATLLDWGSCGTIAYVDSVPAGYATFAPPSHVPRSRAFPTSPVGRDAALLVTAYVRPDFAGGGVARMLIQGVAKELTRRNIKAIEAFGDRRIVGDREESNPATGFSEAPGHNLIESLDPADEFRSGGSCLLPADFLLSVGFKTVRPHSRFPRLRLDLKNAISWREDVGEALERLLGTVNPEPAYRPV
jgi:GNAT superfamily N-acetyltransferase